MSFKVILTDRASEQLEAAYAWFESNAPQYASVWYNGIRDAIIALENDPERFGLVVDDHNYPVAFREVLYGMGKRKTHRVIFTVKEQTVIVRAIRHVAQPGFLTDDQ